MPDLTNVRAFLAEETGLAVVSTTQANGRVLSSVVNCGVFNHPITGETCVALVAMGAAARVGHVRRGSEVTVAVRRGWNWVGVTGPADLIGPYDTPASMDADGVRILLRDVYTAAGGKHDDWDEYDRAMAEDKRVDIFVSPERILGNAPST